MVFLFFLACVPYFLFAWDCTHFTLEEKIGQMVMVHVYGQKAEENARYLIQEKGIGGIIYYEWANGLESAQQVRELSSGLQSLAAQSRTGIPLLISIDQEGGLVCRLKNGCTTFPGNAALARTKKYDWAKKSACMIGRELRSVGISINLAPVIDIASPSQSVIGIRSFGENPKVVAEWGKQMLEGFHEAGILTTLKHFPGHGAAKVDSHLGLPVVMKTKDELEKEELIPFRALSSQTDLMMTAHVFFPALDEEFPVTYSKKVVEDLLRKEMNFSGVIITDSLAMQGAMEFDSCIEKCALKSIQAGHDIILLGGKQLLSTQKGFEFSAVDVDRVIRFLAQAVREGVLSEKRIDESVKRILELKEKVFNTPCSSAPDLAAYQELARAIAKEAIEIVQRVETIPLKNDDSIVLFTPSSLGQKVRKATDSFSSLPMDIFEYKPLCVDEEELHRIKGIVTNQKSCIVIISGHVSLGEQQIYDSLIQMGCKTVVVILRGPEVSDIFMKASMIISTYSPVEYSLEAVFKIVSKFFTIGGENVEFHNKT